MRRVDGPGLRLFEGYGIELELMIVARGSLDVMPLCDRLLKEEGGSYGDVERGDIGWSNELVLHVIELKTNGPAATLAGLGASFQREVRYLDDLLAEFDARLMPTAMHPWMDPLTETRLWPHDFNDVYQLFDGVFGCQGHGWSNLQSMHINLPFSGDRELARLHAAVRLVLPLLPALAASSPIVMGEATGLVDNRLEFYRHNCRAIPVVTGRVIPESVTSTSDYRERILAPIRRAMAVHDPEGVLDPEWVNARGAIARFVRDAIEIRVIDTQEHPGADLAIAALTVAAVRSLVEERHVGFAEQLAFPSEPLEAALLTAIRDGERAPVDERLARVFGVDRATCAATVWRDVWRRELQPLPGSAEWRGPLEAIFEHGPLARRVLTALERGRTVWDIYHELCECLRAGKSFIPA